MGVFNDFNISINHGDVCLQRIVMHRLSVQSEWTGCKLQNLTVHIARLVEKSVDQPQKHLPRGTTDKGSYC